MNDLFQAQVSLLPGGGTQTQGRITLRVVMGNKATKRMIDAAFKNLVKDLTVVSRVVDVEFSSYKDNMGSQPEFVWVDPKGRMYTEAKFSWVFELGNYMGSGGIQELKQSLENGLKRMHYTPVTRF